MSLSATAQFLTARGCLSFLPDGETSPILPAKLRPRLNEAAAKLPPIPRVGLEVRLGADAGRIDLHQLATSEPSEQALLIDHFAGQPLRRFLERWAAPDGRIASVFPYLYLEFDQTDASDGGSPCIFLDVHRRLAAGGERETREKLTLELAAEILAAGGRTLPEALRRCFEAIPDGSSIGHLGMMFGRDDVPLRVNIKQLPRGALVALLEDIGWPGDLAAADALFDSLLDRADRISVALDLRDEWQAGIGFEVFLEAPPARDPRWSQLLEWFCARDVCTPAEREALLAFPAMMTPSTEGPRWPAPWLIAATLAPRDHLPVVTRFLSHLKLSLDERGRPHAKAYLGLYHAWRALPALPEEAPACKPRRDVPPAARAEHVQNAIEAGEAFLRGRLTQGGFWRDFHLGVGFGDEWVTAYIACQLLEGGRTTGRALAERALLWLFRRQRAEGGWGFNGRAPQDADSTAWALRLAAGLGVDDRATQSARAFLERHMLPSGEIATYAPTTPIRYDGIALSPAKREGWSIAHDCVAANAAPFLPAPAMAHLRGCQREEGNWRAHWWRDDLFATALAVESLKQSPADGDEARIGRAVAWACDRPLAESPFELAAQMHLACHGRTPCSVADGFERLVALQDEDGGWPSGAAMLFPLPWERGRTNETILCADQERCFTTATAVAALSLALSAAAAGLLQ